MNRGEFLRVCGGACLGLVGMSVLLQSCGTNYFAQLTMNGNRLQIAKTEFEKIKDGKIKYRRYVLVKPETSKYPIIVYRNDDSSYTALLLRCTHQGNELTASGDILTCSAHGSEFSKTGDVLQGPAEEKLISYVVTTDEKNIYIQLI